MADFTGGPGLLAFIATFSMVLAVVVLFRSLGKHLRKVRTQPPADAGAGSIATVQQSADGTAIPDSTVSQTDPEDPEGTKP